MTTLPIPPTALAKLAELRQPGRVATASDVVELLQAWGFVRGDRIDPEQPELVVFYYHPQQPHLHMSLPSHGSLVRGVTEYALNLVGSMQPPPV